MRKRAALLLLIAHVLVLGGLYAYRYPPAAARTQLEAFERGEFHGSALRLYMSREVEYTWFEWSWLVLGRPLPADYPVAYRSHFELGPLLNEAPRARLPYRDVPFAYPPLLIVPVLAAGLLAIGPLSYLWALALLCTLAWLLALHYARQVWQTLAPAHRLPWTAVLALSLLALLAIGQIAVTRLDAFVALTIPAAVAAHLRGRSRSAAVWLGAGVLLKLTPLLIAPLLLIDLLRAGQRRRALHAVLVGLGIVACGLGVTVAVAGSSALLPLVQHQARPLQLESSWATILLVGHALFDLPVRTFSAGGSWNVAGGGTLLEGLASWVPWLVLLLAYAAYAVRATRPERLVRAVVLTLLLFMLSFRVFSPQFLLWLLPLALLVTRELRLHALPLGALLLTQLLWPNFYFLLERAHPAGIALLAARNLLLLALAAWLVRALLKPDVTGSYGSAESPSSHPHAPRP